MVLVDEDTPRRLNMGLILILGAVTIAAVSIVMSAVSSWDSDHPVTDPETALNPEDTPCPATGGPHVWEEKKHLVRLSGGGYFNYSYVVCSACNLVIMP